MLATADCDAENLWGYTACFPAAFLDQFDQPSRACYAGSLAIWFCEIPLESSSVAADMLREMFNVKLEG